MNETLMYYQKHADAFCRDTENVDFSANQLLFTERLRPGSRVLDLGCGSGRDSAAFLAGGFQVDAIDGCPALCQAASEKTGLKVRCAAFSDLKSVSEYDGIWACASLLHVPKAQLPEIFEKISLALRPGGIFYCSFKYGSFEGMRRGRYFTDLQQNELNRLISGISGLYLEKVWISSDVRTGRECEQWLNALIVRC